MGLDPILILEEPPKNENYIIHIRRPGLEEEEEEEGKNKKNIRLQDKNPIEQESNIPEEVENFNIDLNDKIDTLISTDNISIIEENDLNSTQAKEADEDPRRKRRRSSAST